jgi:hypothetical protein
MKNLRLSAESAGNQKNRTCYTGAFPEGIPTESPVVDRLNALGGFSI